ncbi:8229_t:CDS:1, partial [Gigaspora rosea]
NEPEIFNDEETFILEPEINYADPDSRAKVIIATIIQNLNEKKSSTPFR